MGKELTIFEGKTLDDAVRKGLDALGLTRAEVMITMVEEGSGGFLGIGARPYRVKVMPRPGGPIPEPEYRTDREARPRGGHRREEPRRGGRGGQERGGRRSGPATADPGGREARPPRDNRGGRDERPRDGRRDEVRKPEGARAEEPRRAAPREGAPGDGAPREGAPRDGAPREGGRRDGGRRDGGRRDEPRRDRGDRPERIEARPERIEESPGRIEERPAPVAGERAETPREGAFEGGREGGRRRRRRGGRGGGGGERREERSVTAAPAATVVPELPYVEDHEAPPVAEPAFAATERETRPAPARREERPERRRESHHEGSGSEAPVISNEELISQGQKLTTDFLAAMGFEGTVTATAEEGRVDVKAQITRDEELLTGRKGEVRQALQHLLNRMLNRGEGTRYHLQLEINDFWAQRERELEELARSLAEEALTNQNESVTEYLNSQERRVIHVTLREDTRVKTYALGTGLIKRVAVAPADFPESEREEE